MISAGIGMVVEVAIVASLAAITLVMVREILTNRHIFSGLFATRHGDGISIHRVQMMIVTLLFAAGYVITAINTPAGHGMPDISKVMLAALIGSHAAYLGGKAIS